VSNLAPHELRRYAECRIMPNGLIETAIVSWLAADHSA
jgi:hypothetical protein